MAKYGNQIPVVEDYSVIKQIGSGSFSFVWLARHKVKGHEVAIKEIPTDKLNKKLQESLLSEIQILRKISHPNITKLHETKETQGRIYLILEYCTGGDLSTYINNHGKVSEDTARYFMRQLAAGLLVLREHNLIHRDLKPQNLLLSTGSDNPVLKIADFGFARPLQPQGLAETLCGSPLYMAPEIMQFQKYDAKADLWSVGTILYQLVTGKTPFYGNNQMQLMQNILKSNELKFPRDLDLSSDCRDLCRSLLRQNPVERLTFEEFFNHKFIFGDKLESSSKLVSSLDAHSRESSMSGGNPLSDTGDSSQDDSLPFPLDDDLRVQVGSSSLQLRENTMANSFKLLSSISVAGNKAPTNLTGSRLQFDKKEVTFGIPTALMGQNQQKSTHYKTLDAPASEVEHRLLSAPSRETDSFEYDDQEYVFVPATPRELSSSSYLSPESSSLPSKVAKSPPTNTQGGPPLSAPMPIVRGTGEFGGSFDSRENNSSVRSGTSASSADLELLDQPSVNPPTRLRSLMRCAHAITELAKVKLKEKKQLEAFSLQLVCLAIWKQALHICHDWAATATEEMPPIETALCTSEDAVFQGAASACALIEQKFLEAVELAELIAPSQGNEEMPDTMELIFQEALILGRKGAVDELMGNMKAAALSYSNSVSLLCFLLVEASYLPLSPSFSISKSDRHRLHRYVDMLSARQSQCSAERMVCRPLAGLQSV